MALLSKFNFTFKPLGKATRCIHKYLPEPNFLTIHYMYFMVVSLLSAVIFWGISTPAREVRFIDALFLCVSAMTLTGLNTINLSTCNTAQQVMLFLLIMFGSAILVSAVVVHIRRKAFEERFRSVLAKEQRGRGGASWFPIHRSLSRRRGRSRTRTVPPRPESREQNAENQANPQSLSDNGELEDATRIEKRAETEDGTDLDQASDFTAQSPVSLTRSPEGDFQDHITFSRDTRFNDSRTPGLVHRALNMSGVGARSSSQVGRLTMQSSARASHDASRAISSHSKDEVVSSGFIARNSNFHHLTEADRLRLGGTEYKAVSFLAWVVPMYYVMWQFLGALSIGAFINNYYPSTARENGLNPWWVGAFNAISAFNNSGMSLLDANMTAFNKAIYMLLTMALLILAGNTCYPIFLRLIVYIIRKLMPNNEDWKDARHTLQFLLDHPRRCYTNLFPSQHTWWLLLSVVILNGIDCVAFTVLNIGNREITDLPPGIEFIDGLFQATAVRSGGFYVVPIPSVRISLQVLYVIMMYISAFPVAITIRNSNVYEERSLGIYSDDPGYDMAGEMGSAVGWLKRRLGGASQEATKRYFIQQQLRAQLAHDLWWLVLAIFFIMIIEGGQFQSNPAVFSVFNVIFEVVSGYGTVGISIGLPDEAYSFCGSWHTLSKLILCAVMLRGRHRGLPVAIDKAVLLPSEHLNDLEEEDAHIRSDRSMHDGSGV